jgi:two-component system cell cycle response regulator
MSIRVLVVDDSATVRFKLKTLLEKHGLAVEQAGNVGEALARLAPGHAIDVIVTDLRMPGLDGNKLVDSVGRCDELNALPVVVLTSSEEKDDRLRNIESGAAAYFNKGKLDEDEFVVQIRRLAKQKASTTELKHDSRTDRLTGIASRRYGDVRLAEELQKLARYGQPFAVALLDIDHFKRINDSLGHKAGDDVLRRLAAELRAVSRASDLVVRWGGEEFLFVFPGTSASQAAGIVERLRAHLAATPIALDGGTSVPVTISGGVAEAQAGESAEDLVARADKGLYRAKETGRNRLLRWEAGELLPVAAA